VAKQLAQEDERITLADAARMLGKTKKAVEQLVHRGSLRSEVEQDAKTGRTLRRFTTRGWVDEYAATARGEVRLREGSSLSQAVSVGVMDHAPEQSGSKYWREIAEELASENLRLQVRVRELEAQLRRR
jgi:hypothetical protein